MVLDKKKQLFCFVFFIMCICMTGLIIYITGDLRYSQELKENYGSWDIASYNTPIDFYKELNLEEENEIGRIVPIGITNKVGFIGGMDDNIPSLTSFQLIEGTYPSTTKEIVLVQQYDTRNNPIYKVGDNINTKITRSVYGDYDVMSSIELWNENNQEETSSDQEDTSLIDVIRSYTLENRKREYPISNSNYEGTLTESYLLHIPSDITITDEIIDTYGQLVNITWSVDISLKITGIIEPYETHMRKGTEVLCNGFVTMDMTEELKEFYYQQDNRLLNNEIWSEHIFIDTKQKDTKTYNRIRSYIETYQEELDKQSINENVIIGEKKVATDSNLTSNSVVESKSMNYQSLLNQTHLIENTYTKENSERYSIHFIAILIALFSIVFCAVTLLNRFIIKYSKISLKSIVCSGVLGLLTSLFIGCVYLSKVEITINQLELEIYIKIIIAAVSIIAMFLCFFYKQQVPRNQNLTEDEGAQEDNVDHRDEVIQKTSKDTISSDNNAYITPFHNSQEKITIDDELYENAVKNEELRDTVISEHTMSTSSKAYIEELRKVYGRQSFNHINTLVLQDERDQDTVNNVNLQDKEEGHNGGVIHDIEAVHIGKVKFRFGYFTFAIVICKIISISLVLITLQRYNFIWSGNNPRYNYQLETVGMPDTNRKFSERGISELEGVEYVSSYRYSDNIVLMSENISKDPMFDREMKEVDELSKSDELSPFYNKKDQIIYNKEDRYVSTSIFSINSDEDLFQEIKTSITIEDFTMEQYEKGEMVILLVPMRNDDNTFYTFKQQYKDILHMESEVEVGERILISRYDIYEDKVFLNAKVYVTIGGIIYYYPDEQLFSEYDSLDYAVIGSSNLYKQLYTENMMETFSSSSMNLSNASYDRVLTSKIVTDSIGKTIYYINGKSNEPNHIVETALERFANDNYYTMEIMNPQIRLERIQFKGGVLSILLVLVSICIAWLVTLYDYHQKNIINYKLPKTNHRNRILGLVAIVLGHIIGIVGYGLILLYCVGIKYEFETPLPFTQKLSMFHNYMLNHYPYLLHVVLVSSMLLLGYYILNRRSKVVLNKNLETPYVLQDGDDSSSLSSYKDIKDINDISDIKDTWAYEDEDLDVRWNEYDKNLHRKESQHPLDHLKSKEDYGRRLYETFARKKE